MGRPPLPVGTWGNITVEGTPGHYVARCRFRDFDGVTRPVKRVGKTKGEARANLTSHLTTRSTPSGDAITAESRLSEVAAVWLAEVDDGKRAPNTIKRYRDALEDHILGGVGNLRVREATVSRLDRFIKATASGTGAPTAKVCSTVLSGVMGLAVRHDAIPTNPMRGVAGVTVTTPEAKAMDLDQVDQLRRKVWEWQTTPKRGRPPSQDLADLVDMLLATGARPGEVLALRWSDIDLTAETVTLCGTIVMSDTKPSRAVRQEYRKNKKPITLRLPRFAVDMLLRRQVNAQRNIHDAVFPSAAGTWRDPGNVRKTLDKVLADSHLEWVTPKTFRKTVGTLLANEDDAQRAADQLGDSDVNVIRKHYWQRPDVATDSTHLLQQLAPRNISVP